MHERMLKLIPIVMFIILLVTSCVDEPYIEPVKTPFSTIRVGNFTNTDFSLFVDGQQISGNLAKNTVTDYFDVTSGSRRFVMLSGQDTVYNREIEIISYEEVTVVFNGYYDAANPDDTEIGFRSLLDGKTYLNDGFVDSTNVAAANFVNGIVASSDSAVTEAVFEVVLTDTTSMLDTLALPLDNSKNNILVGEHAVNMVVGDDTATTSTVFQSGKKYYLFAAGDPGSRTIVVAETTPPPARSK